MDVMYLLIPLSVLLVLAIVGVFGWAINNGQLDDLEREGGRILEETTELDGDQARSGPGSEESRASTSRRQEHERWQ